MLSVDRLNAWLAVILICLSVVNSEKYQFCVVDGKGSVKRTTKYCPTLDRQDSPVKCVVGVDRLDCLRQIQKGTADFAVFTPEDLITATNSEIEVLLTNELRYTSDDFEYQVVAVVNDASGIKNRHDLEDKRFCHPGYGYETDWNRILSNYLEASVIPQNCDPKLTVVENRIRASSKFFKGACKAGPWVNIPSLDAELKTKYPNLCALCSNPVQCSKDDEYAGRRGSLFCLTDGAGDFSWSRWDDVQQHFGLTPGGTIASPDGYSLMCPDGSIMPVNTTSPCVWVVRPWPVIATKRTSAQEIQQLISTLNRAKIDSWQVALLNLMESYRVNTVPIQPLQPIETYLNKATGFLNAYSFSGCHPPRTVRICTTSVIENAKCIWLRESANAYGIEPDVDCVMARNTTHCMEALNDDVADVVMVSHELVRSAMSKFNLRTLFYETVQEADKYITYAITRNPSSIKTFEDLRGKSACFPVYDGVAWNSVEIILHNQGLMKGCPLDAAMAHFFGPSCVPKLPNDTSLASLSQKCGGNVYEGEYGAIRCLTQKNADVAFVSKNSLQQFLKDSQENPKGEFTNKDFAYLCPQDISTCHLSWAPIGQAMVRANSSSYWMKDTLDMFQQLDNNFGRFRQASTTPFTMFGPFDSKSNVLFHDVTVRLRNIPFATNTDTMLRPYDSVLGQELPCVSSATINVSSSLVLLLSLLMKFCYM